VGFDVRDLDEAEEDQAGQGRTGFETDPGAGGDLKQGYRILNSTIE
jgi:hypothetical protein